MQWTHQCAIQWFIRAFIHQHVLYVGMLYQSFDVPSFQADFLWRMATIYREYAVLDAMVGGFALFEYIHECIIHLSIVFWYDSWNLYTPNRYCIYNFAENIKKQFHCDLESLNNAGATLDFWMMLVQHLNDDSCSAVCEHHLDRAASYHGEFFYPPHLDYFTMALS